MQRDSIEPTARLNKHIYSFVYYKEQDRKFWLVEGWLRKSVPIVPVPNRYCHDEYFNTFGVFSLDLSPAPLQIKCQLQTIIKMDQYMWLLFARGTSL